MRRRGLQIPLYNINGSLVRNITPREAYELEAGGTASLSHTNTHGKKRELLSAMLRLPVQPGQPGVATIRMSESVANGTGQMRMIVNGRRTDRWRSTSRTARMVEADKLQNTRRIKYASGVEVEVPEPEDSTERAQGKITLWALAGDTKAVRVGPMPDAAALKLAAELAVQGRLYPN